MTTVKITVSYDGTSYVGWQSQKNGVSVQDVLESALERVVKKKTRITGSGRTDAGVHAAGQVAHFRTDSSVPPERFSFALNALLPADVRVLKSERVEDGFNARYSAKRKTYRYSLYISPVSLPLKERYAVRCDTAPDVERMRAAARLFEGEHDFAKFSSTGSSVKTSVRTIYSIGIIKEGDDIKIDVCGNGFLYNMVRIIVGSLLACAYGKVSENELIASLSGESRPAACKTLAAKGLTLLSVEYE